MVCRRVVVDSFVGEIAKRSHRSRYDVEIKSCGGKVVDLGRYVILQKRGGIVEKQKECGGRCIVWQWDVDVVVVVL